MTSKLEDRVTAAVDVPSVGDLEFYRMVTVEGASTHTVARMTGQPQAQVCEGVERVLAWMAAVLPLAAKEMPEDTRLKMAEQVAVMRLDSLYGEALAAWRSSQSSETFAKQRRISLTGELVLTENAKREHGNVRYLAAATVICLKMAKLPASLIPLASMKHSPELTAADLEAAAEMKAAAASSPPVRDCSADSDQPEQEADVAAVASDATIDSIIGCDVSKAPDSAVGEPTLTVFTPVQTRSEPAAGGQRPPGATSKNVHLERPAKLLASG